MGLQAPRQTGGRVRGLHDPAAMSVPLAAVCCWFSLPPLEKTPDTSCDTNKVIYCPSRVTAWGPALPTVACWGSENVPEQDEGINFKS